MRLLLLSLFATALLAQQVPQEGFFCATGTVSANPHGGPTTIQCLDGSGNPQAHNFPAGTHIMLWGATGNWRPLNSQTYQSLSMVVSASGTSIYLNDTGMLETTPGALYQVYPESGGGYCNNTGYNASQEQVGLVTVVDSHKITVTRAQNGTIGSPHCPEDYLWGPLNRPVTWAVTIVDSTHISVPLDSSSFGSFTGQHIHINRASAYGQLPVPYMISSTADGSAPALEVQDNNMEKFTIEGCPDKTNAIYCSFAYSDPINQKGYGSFAATGSLVVSGGVGTFTLMSWASGTTTATRVLQANELFWLWNFSDERVNRPWVVSTITGSCASSCIITVVDMGTGAGGAGVPDGTYTVTGTDSHGSSFYFPIYADYYTYFGPGMASPTNYPTEYTAHMVEGTFRNDFNRFRAWYCWSSTMTAIPMEFGSYPTANPTTYHLYGHFYHSVVMDTYGSQGACQWQLFEVNAFPLHGVGGPPWVPQGNEPMMTGWVGYGPFGGESTHYFDINRTFYMNLSSIYAVPGPQTSYIGPMYYDTVAGEPEEWVIYKTVSYNPNAGKYHFNVVAGPETVGTPCSNFTYEFYYSTNELKALGLNNATFDGTSDAVSYGVNRIWQINHDSANLPLRNMYFGIRPRMCIAGVSASGQSLNIGFRQDPNMQVGDHVTITGVGGNTAVNQSNVAITAVQPRQFFWRSNQGYGVTPVQLLNITVTGGNLCTVNLAVQPNAFVGQEAAVTGTPAGSVNFPVPSYISWVKITGIGTNSFTFSCPGSTNGIYNTDYASNIPMGVALDPYVTIAGTGNGTWDGQYTGSMVSTENNKNFAEITFTPPQPGAPVISTTVLPPSTVGVAYSQALTASGGASPYTWSIASGSLPHNLTLNSSTGVISGSPDVAGSSSFTVAVTGSDTLSTSAALSITINPAVLVTTTILPGGAVLVAYSQPLSASGGTGTLTWSIASGSLPGGLSLNTAGGITGTPTAAGVFNFTVTATDTVGASNSKSLSLSVAAGAPIVTSLALPPSTVGAAYSQTLTATGGLPPYTWSISSGSLPQGLSLNSSTGVISGTPGIAGSSTFTVTVTGADAASGSATLSIVINPAVSVTTTILSSGTAGMPYSQTLTSSGGTGAITWSLDSGTLPDGLSLSSTGAITGTPTAMGAFNFTVRATDAVGASAVRALTVTVLRSTGSTVRGVTLRKVTGH